MNLLAIKRKVSTCTSHVTRYVNNCRMLLRHSCS